MNGRFAFPLLLPALAFAALGCGGSEPTGGPPAPIGSAMGEPSGNKVFDANCMGCHSTKDGNTQKKAPNLSKVGATRTPEWLADHVKNPKTHQPDSKMPEFGTKLSAEDLKSVTDFMAGLK